MSYKRQGSGECLLFLHGYNSSKESFFYQFQGISGYDLLAPDLAGFGRSELAAPYGVGDYVEWVKTFLDKLELSSVNIVAHSFGARVAIKLAANFPDRVKKLVIVGGAGLKKQSAKNSKKIKRYRQIKKFFPKFAERHFGSSDYRSLSPMKKESFKKIINEDLRGDAARIEAKTLLIYGENDRETPFEEEGVTFNKLIKNSRLVKTEGGHFCFSEHPLTFNELVGKFLTE